MNITKIIIDISKSLLSTIKKLIPKHQSSIQFNLFILSREIHLMIRILLISKKKIFTSIGSKLASQLNNVDHSNLNHLPEVTTAKLNFDVCV